MEKGDDYKLKALVCGGRDFMDREYLDETLDLFNKAFPITELVHGGAKGADKMAGDWAKKKGIKITVVEAEWDKYGKSAGYIRNAAMADLNPNVCIAFAGGKGTMMMKGICLKRGIEVVDHYNIV